MTLLAGTSGPDELTGTPGDDVIDGKGGADVMTCLQGNDTYVVDNIGDAVVEAAIEGADTVKSSVTYALSVNVENLILTGTVAINGSGGTHGTTR